MTTNATLQKIDEIVFVYPFSRLGVNHMRLTIIVLEIRHLNREKNMFSGPRLCLIVDSSVSFPLPRLMNPVLCCAYVWNHTPLSHFPLRLSSEPPLSGISRHRTSSPQGGSCNNGSCLIRYCNAIGQSMYSPSLC